MSLRSRAEELLRHLTDNPAAEFHPDQWEAIEALVERPAAGPRRGFHSVHTPTQSRKRSLFALSPLTRGLRGARLLVLDEETRR